MTVQIPVLLWTVICFGALILILENLLFKPMLAFMDRREERIRRAAEKKAATERALSEAEEDAERFREEEEKHLAVLSAEALAEARREADRMRSEAAARHEDHLAERRRTLEKESEEIRGALDEKAEDLAEAWLSSLIG